MRKSGILLRKLIRKYKQVCPSCLEMPHVFIRCRSNYPHGRKSRATLIPKKVHVKCKCREFSEEIDNLLEV